MISVISVIPKNDFISLHRNSVNTGFGSGNMKGTKIAKASYLLFLNVEVFFM